jgi:hypothetical protein
MSQIVTVVIWKKMEDMKKLKVSCCYNRDIHFHGEVILHVPALMCHTTPVHQVPLQKMTMDRLVQIYRHHKSQQPCGGHCLPAHRSV